MSGRLLLAAAIVALAGACSFDFDAYDPRLGGDGATLDATATTTATSSGGSGGTGGTGGTASEGGQGGSGRISDGLVVLYTFDEGSGSTVDDHSGVRPPLPLTVAEPGAVVWPPGALRIVRPTIVSSTLPATKVVGAVQATSEITVEVWFRPGDLAQLGPARILTQSVNLFERNFTLGQQGTAYFEARLRTTASDLDGVPELSTPSDAGDVTLALTQLVLTRDADGVRKLYVNALERASDVTGGDLSNWNVSYALALGNEFTLDRPWLGELHRVAIYARALDGTEVAQLFAAGP